MIERGRRDGLSRLVRLCPLCRHIVETEHHAFNCCPDHEAARGALRQQLFAAVPAFAQCTEKQLLGLMVNPRKEFAAIVGRFFRSVLDKVDARYLVQEVGVIHW